MPSSDARNPSTGPGPGYPSSPARPASIVEGVPYMDDDDSYDLDEMGVSDGFRPMNESSQFSSDATSVSAFSARPLSTPDPQVPATTTTSTKYLAGMANRPSSLSKAHRPHDSLTLQHDGSNPTAGSFYSRTPTQHQPGESPILPIDTPYQGPSGPSHPYGMYVQRTLSNATSHSRSGSAVAAASRSFGTSGGPMHPYALYTQNTTSEEEETAQHNIPVGFTGMNGAYTRQIGPDGEESGGLIGPLGHTEELPPYTKYPPEAYVPSRPVAQAQPIASIPAPIAGAGGIGIATRNPEFSSTDEDLPLPFTRPLNQSISNNSSEQAINADAEKYDEKSRRARWQKRARKKLCGVVPYWAICLLVAGIVIISIILGAVIGRLLANDESEKPKENGSDYDSGPYQLNEPEFLEQLPSGLPSLSMGTFGIPPLNTDNSPTNCFNDTTQTATWTCDIPLSFFSLDILSVRDGSDSTRKYGLTFNPVATTDLQFIYGASPPNISQPVILTLVNDTFDAGRNPAWWMKMTYDKTVYIPEDAIDVPEDVPTINGKRQAHFEYSESSNSGFYSSQYKRKSKGATDGEKPWICTWPDTTLEIFIYPTQNVRVPNASTTSSAPAATPIPEQMAYEEVPAEGEPLLPYPNVIKFLERRLSNENDYIATCRQVEVFNGGSTLVPVRDPNGDQVVVNIVGKPESRRTQVSQRSEAAPVTREELTDCGCLWRYT
ncbi:hypothetical protein S7711_03270 [Stachybotrys chartarum IBT 7711]|uniref:DUF7820 domain-containing protein n=1 Tax=Stachybotrys chartarum (strain CBS 109288 / IBT 7711) TaxID=1280523 RepID=A0A084AZP6_STACB|nr:hypothetical protein S7711_03270 [Stachybotrys chartarum IBT 7711]KFA50919.1 hypothetical protein S40293_02440 [Stachybotrys chartarum IBT 40293]KFA76262.1 hypothetical protein S40288_03628 [Stachybotrys chartarum IBT 40288]